MILIIDNFDSFVENIARYVRLCGSQTLLKKNNEISIEEIEKLNPSAIIISPGPSTPLEAGISVPCILKFFQKIPILGVCLGHQAIVHAFGGDVFKGTPCHGHSSNIAHSGEDIFKNIPHICKVGRYHSLHCTLPSDGSLIETAYTIDKKINMGLKHKDFPVFGVQFHPESLLTEHGLNMIQNFVNIVNTHDR